MLPLALQCKFHEALPVEKAMRILEQIPAAIPLAARVDGIYFAAKDMTTLHEVEAHATRHKYGVSERSVYCLKDCKIDNMPMNPQQWGYSMVMGPITRPWRHVHKNDPTFEQIGTSCGIWTEQEDVSYEDKVVRYIMCRRGGLATGAAGTGKSEILKNYEMLERIQKMFFKSPFWGPKSPLFCTILPYHYSCQGRVQVQSNIRGPDM